MPHPIQFCARLLGALTGLIILSTGRPAAAGSLPVGGEFDLCQRLLHSVTRAESRPGEEHPVPMFYRAIDVGLDGASLEVLGPGLASYVDLSDLPDHEALKPGYVPPDAQFALKRELGIQIREVFAAAAAAGVDQDLARLGHSMRQVHRVINAAFHAGQRGDHWEFVDAAAVEAHLTGEASWDLEKHLTAARLSWAALSPAVRHAFVGWVGRVIYDFVPMYKRGRPNGETGRYVPQFRQSKEEFVRARGGNSSAAEGQFYRQVGGGWMSLYGIAFDEHAFVPAAPPPRALAAPVAPTPVRRGWLSRVFGR